MEKSKIVIFIFIILLVSIFSGCNESMKDENVPTDVNLLPFSSVFKGYVKDSKGNNIENLKIAVSNSKYDWQDTNYTSSSGFYSFSVFSGYFVINTEHEYYEAEKTGKNIENNQTIWVNFSLTDLRDDFTFSLLNGKNDKLSNYRGKVVLVDMWATWCNPCSAVMPELKKAYDDTSRDEVEIISINIDARENAKMIQDFIDEFAESGIELNWIFGMDTGNVLSEKYMKEGAIPTLAIFDQMGRLHFRKAGVVAYEEIPYYFPDTTPLLAPIIDELLE
jgi:thiol-disulfide isomerase/thioredoxin